MKKQLLFVLILILFTATISVGQNIKFERAYVGTGYNFGYSVTQTFDNGYAVAGSTTGIGNGSTDIYLLKTDSLGIIQWEKTFGGINIDQAFSIQETKDSGLVIAGFTNSFGNGGYDIYVVRTNSLGDTIWTKTYGGSNWDFGYSIEQTADSGFVITGGTYSFGQGYEDMYLIRINPVGDTLWTKTYGGTKDDEARSVKQTMDGGFIITGTTKSFGDSVGDFYSVKTDALGDTLWTNKYGGNQEEEAFDILQEKTGGYIVGGKTKSSGNGNFDGLIINLSSSGIVTGNKTYGGTDDDGIHSIQQSASGRIALAGYTYTFGFASGTPDFLLYLDNPFASGTYGGSDADIAYCINKTKDKGYIICGNSKSFGNLDEIFLVKTDSNGLSPQTPTITVTDVNNLTTGTNNSFKSYPNPANDNFYLRFNKETISPVIISITDIIGRIYYQKTININVAEPLEINTSNLQAGIYIIHVEGDNYMINQKLIIEH
jgi:Secretion system C-terminal sorting domain